MITLQIIRQLAKSLPNCNEGTSYGTAAFRARKKLFLRLHDREDAIVLRVNSIARQAALISEDPMSFYITPHYEGHPFVLIRPTLDISRFESLFIESWRSVASQADLAEYLDTIGG